MNKNIKTEILSPAGNKEAFLSAIHHGANAIYLGGLQFGARSQAQNFTTEEIIELINYAHLYDVKVYVTVNTLIKEKEFEEVVEFVEELYINNVDAIIIQDIGLATYLLNVYPDIVLHASTQMNIHTLEQAKFIKSLGFKRIVLARECSIDVIKQIKENVDIELEVFVHGALCMSYSGNCLMSSFIGKRSGNRGKCAQPCRLLYSLDDNDKPSYLLSPKDLMTLDKLNQLLDLKIDSLKIEGRMKRSEYVGLVTKIYSDAVNSYYNKEAFDFNTSFKQLKELFNREFTKGYIFNESNKEFTNVKFSNHIGVKVGNVFKVVDNYIYIKLLEPLVNGDSIRIVGKKEDAVTISEMYLNNILVKQANVGDSVRIRCHKELDVNAIVLKTSNIKLLNDVNNYQEIKLLIDGNVFVRNNRLVLSVRYKDIVVEQESSIDVEASDNPNFKSRIYDQLNKLNNTIYKFNKLDLNINNIFLPISAINELRRSVIEKLNEKRLQFKEKSIEFESLKLNKEITKDNFKLLIKVENEAQYLAVNQLYKGKVITESISLYNKYKENMIYLNPRIESKKQLNGGIQNYNLNNDYILCSNYSNVYNSNSILFYHNQGIKYVGLSVEMSSAEMKQAIDSFIHKYKTKPNTFVMVYGRYELMLMKHCLINKKLGLNNKGCNKCLEKQYYLKDRMGFKFPLIKSENCNLKLLNSKTVNLINNIDEIKNNGVNGILLDFTIENEMEVSKVLTSYINKLNGENVKLQINDVTYGHFNEGIL